MKYIYQVANRISESFDDNFFIEICYILEASERYVAIKIENMDSFSDDDFVFFDFPKIIKYKDNFNRNFKPSIINEHNDEMYFSTYHNTGKYYKEDMIGIVTDIWYKNLYGDSFVKTYIFQKTSDLRMKIFIGSVKVPSVFYSSRFLKPGTMIRIGYDEYKNTKYLCAKYYICNIIFPIFNLAIAEQKCTYIENLELDKEDIVELSFIRECKRSYALNRVNNHWESIELEKISKTKIYASKI